MASITNEPISYDDHGDIPLGKPFREISPTDISIYLQLNTNVGKSTCQQTCGHCFYINQPEARGRAMDLVEGRRVMAELARRGYKIFPMISDSFANGGEFLMLFGNSHNRDYRQEADRRPTKTMERGEMWTSGAPLLGDDCERLLALGVASGFGSVTITFHGVLDEALTLMPHHAYPISGVFPGRDCERVVANVHKFNASRGNGSGRDLLEVNLGVTIGKHNHGRENLIRYVRYFDRLGVAVVRFNCYHDHGWRYPHLRLSRDEIAAVYRDLKWIHANIPFQFQLGLDEDFGTNGIEVMGFPAHTGICQAGRQLFAVVPDDVEILHEDGALRRERIGTMAGCVDAFKPIVGRLVREIDKSRGSVTYDLEFFHDVIEELTQKRLNGTYTDGCFAGEMLSELRSQWEADRDGRRGRLPIL